jgi:hypothetical protein
MRRSAAVMPAIDHSFARHPPARQFADSTTQLAAAYRVVGAPNSCLARRMPGNNSVNPSSVNHERSYLDAGTERFRLPRR